MKKFLKKFPPAVFAYRLLKGMAGAFRMLGASIAFGRDFREFSAMSVAEKDGRFNPQWKDRYPCLGDRTQSHGFDAHYIYHTGWAARILKQTRPKLHVDISSSLYFVSILSAFVPVKFYDYRPAGLKLSGVSAGSADIQALPFKDNSIASLSCMHVVEHIGLGRYGDPISPTGDRKAMGELARVLGKGGDLLFVVPVGMPKVYFNAHRVYSYDQVIEGFKGLKLKRFTLIPDNAAEKGMIEGAGRDEVGAQLYGCGCFWFTKK